MGTTIEVNFDCDFPCEDWEEKECPMKKKWKEGDTVMCGKCSWNIWYNENQETKTE